LNTIRSTVLAHIPCLPRTITVFAWTLLLVCAIGLSCTTRAQTPTFNEYQLKAVFLFNFAQFVDWPQAGAAQTNDSFTICVLGNDPFDRYLYDTVRGEKLNERNFIVRRFRSVEEIDDCRILFISNSEIHRVRQVLAGLKDKSILTVSDVDRFADLGGIVEFVTAEKHIRLKINVEAARAANLTISSKLLRPATIVATSGG
jgi:hypothetical protein